MNDSKEAVSGGFLNKCKFKKASFTGFLMNLISHTNNIVSLKRLAVVLSISCATLSIATLVLLSSNLSIHERIVVVPPGLAGPVAIDWGRADAEYIKSFGVFYATLIGTITPKNVDYVADRLSSMTSADAYPVIRKKLLALSRDPIFQGSGTSINFISNGLVYEPERNKVFVIGENRIQSGFGPVKATQMVYELDIKIIDGRPVVMLLQNYLGERARTQEWLTQHPELVNKESTQ
jgi:conjugal transfer pilus assembly protein TraE